jgi:hypothetical protein
MRQRPTRPTIIDVATLTHILAFERDRRTVYTTPDQPTSETAMTSATTPRTAPADVATIDPAVMRLMAVLSAGTLLIALITALAGRADLGALLVTWQWAMATFAATLGPRRSPYGALLTRILPDGAAEPDRAARFSQAIASLMLSAAVAALIFGGDAVAWTLVATVAAVSAALAVTGFCIGCVLYGVIARRT